MSTTSPAPTTAESVLQRFGPATREWFTSSFSAPTAAQVGAWDAISTDQHALVVAPTGSGKTLSAFLWAVDRLMHRAPVDEAPTTCSVIYISPLKALAHDIERNLRAPLVGITHAATRLGLSVPTIQVATRTGDTSPQERRQFATKPADILITTPESLYLLLTSAARSALTSVTTVIIDEIHALAGTKRGAHCALTLERLDALLPAPVQRIGLSATVQPVDAVARFLVGARPPGQSGGRPVHIVQPAPEKQWDLTVRVPVADMSELGTATGDLSGQAAGEPQRASLWPHVEAEIVDLIDPIRNPGKATLVFTNARRTAERLTARLNEAWAERLNPPGDTSESSYEAGDSSLNAVPPPMRGMAVERFPHNDITHPRSPAEMMGASGVAAGAPAELARAHHGSVSKEHRKEIEEALKSGALPAVVSTSSLELGIDMGRIDLVVQVAPPPSVAAGLQRVGRAGHQVGAVSRGVIFPRHRSELLATAVVTERMYASDIEAIHVPSNPLDVLAQHIVAMVAMDDWTVPDLLQTVRRAAPFSELSQAVMESVLDMLAGRYPSTEFADLKPKIVWDRITSTLTQRPGAQRIAVTSGGTIPDRGLFGVFLASGEGPGRRVGELDEEMVYESRVGDVFTLGTSTWRIEDITYDRVLVSPAPGQPARLPFWRGETLGRSAELGRGIGQMVRDLHSAPGGFTGEASRARLARAGLDQFAIDNTVRFLQEQADSCGVVPDDKTIVVERFRDELGDWRVIIHSPMGMAVHAPWALVIGNTLADRFGFDVQAMPTDDGIVLRLPDMVSGEDGSDPLGDDLLPALLLDPDTIVDDVTTHIGGSALFASRFRECAARALLLPKRRPNQRQPLWQQRQRAAQLLEVAAKYPSFPIILETVRECLQDVFDVPNLRTLLSAIAARTVQVVQVRTERGSPFAQAMMFNYVAQFLYEGDSPLAERRAAALALDPELLNDLLGRSDGTSLADLLDPDSVREVYEQLQRLTPERQARSAEDVVDLLRALGPLTPDQLQRRTQEHVRSQVPQWLCALHRQLRIIEVPIAGSTHYAIAEDAGMLRDALGVPTPIGLPEAFTEVTTDPFGALLVRYARSHVAFTAHTVAATFGLGTALVRDALHRLERQGTLTSGALLPAALIGTLPDLPWPQDNAPETQWCDAEVMRRLRRRSLAVLRAEVEPVAVEQFTQFLTQWQHVATWHVVGESDQGHTGRPWANDTRHRAGPRPGIRRIGGLRGVDGVMTVIESLAGVPLPASAWESLVLPARVTDYQPAYLDELCTAGEVIWTGHGQLSASDGWIALTPTDLQPVLGALPSPDAPGSATAAVLSFLLTGGAYHFRDIVHAVRAKAPEQSESSIAASLWELVWMGLATNDTLAVVRSRLAGGTTTHRAPKSPPRTRYHRTSLRRNRSAAAQAPPGTSGRWSAVPASTTDATVRAHARTEVLLDRYGILTRGSVAAEDVPGGFAAVYKVLSAKEDTGQVRRGYFVESLGAAQFATAGAVDQVRASGEATTSVVLAATDPAQPYGAALPWPSVPDQSTKHRPGRKPGALVCLHAGQVVAYMERGAKSLLTFTDDGDALRAAATLLSQLVTDAKVTAITITSLNGDSTLTSAHPMREALLDSGFHVTPQGIRIRRA